MQNIQPIETQYRGYRFRSRIEARWAVFFDFLKIEWEYEKEGYDLGKAGWYLPDFWLPTLGECGIWCEVKGKDASELERGKCHQLQELTSTPVLLLEGQVSHGPFLLFCWDLSDSSGGSSEWDVVWGQDQDGDVTLFVLPQGSRWICWDSMFENPIDGTERIGSQHRTIMAMNKARSARFEHGRQS